MKLPDFIIAGATRSGTSTLFEALRKNNHIYLPDQKELHHFYRDGEFEQGNEFYARHFQNAPKNAICGDISPTYLTHGYTLDHDLKHKWNPDDDSATRIAKTFPNIKIIITLRQPTMRAHSFFARTVWQGHETATTFEHAIAEEQGGQRTPQTTPLCPLYLSHYKTHLSHWLTHFNKDQILLLILEEWSKEPAQTIEKIENFISAPNGHLTNQDIQPTNQGRSNTNPILKPFTRLFPQSKILRKLNRKLFTKSGYDTIKPETLNHLNTVFADDIAYIEDYLSRPLPAWRTPQP